MTEKHNIHLIDEDDIIEMAYDLFLEGAMDNLEPADQLIFALQFEESGAAELIDLTDNWQGILPSEANLSQFSEVIIGLAKNPDDELDDIFARVLISRHPTEPFHSILWKK
ncbi:HI1450 family dsDNA-mimic protein [Providencia sp. PROV129]|uniref:HI1450 family dsDNA-mimic protein n=1 Tax=Providencia sp. PROV129 TaxID=2949839 RepID=UPI00234946E4|nr:HI1450 family dsDNA-mimic protein [Providencia sp. PROV129]